MVARPPLKVVIEPMRLEDVDEVQRIEEASFTTPWPPNAYRSELMTNKLAAYLVVRAEGRIVAYGGMWLMVDEAHITTFAVHPAWRRPRLGGRVLVGLPGLAEGPPAPGGAAGGPPSEVAAPRVCAKDRVPPGGPPPPLSNGQPAGR